MQSLPEIDYFFLCKVQFFDDYPSCLYLLNSGRILLFLEPTILIPNLVHELNGSLPHFFDFFFHFNAELFLLGCRCIFLLNSSLILSVLIFDIVKFYVKPSIFMFTQILFGHFAIPTDNLHWLFINRLTGFE